METFSPSASSIFLPFLASGRKKAQWFGPKRLERGEKSFINHRITNPVGTFPLLFSLVNPTNRSLFANNFLIYHYQPKFPSRSTSSRSGWEHDRVAGARQRKSLSEGKFDPHQLIFSHSWWIFHHFSRLALLLPNFFFVLSRNIKTRKTFKK